MKIVSVVVFVCGLVGSWFLVYTSRPISEAMHVGIQNDLQNVIAEYVQKNLPESKNLRFDRFWTETIKANQVRANFVYSFEDPTQDNGEVTVQIEGSALLDKGDETAESVTWNLKTVQIKGNRVDFQEPIHITADKTQPSADEKTN